jgi:hypothetical protein
MEDCCIIYIRIIQIVDCIRDCYNGYYCHKCHDCYVECIEPHAEHHHEECLCGIGRSTFDGCLYTCSTTKNCLLYLTSCCGMIYYFKCCNKYNPNAKIYPKKGFYETTEIENNIPDEVHPPDYEQPNDQPKLFSLPPTALLSRQALLSLYHNKPQVAIPVMPMNQMMNNGMQPMVPIPIPVNQMVKNGAVPIPMNQMGNVSVPMNHPVMNNVPVAFPMPTNGGMIPMAMPMNQIMNNHAVPMNHMSTPINQRDNNGATQVPIN